MGFFGDLFGALGSIAGVGLPFLGGAFGGPAGAAAGPKYGPLIGTGLSGLGSIFGGIEDRNAAEAARKEQMNLNQQYLDYLNRTNEQNYNMWRDQNIYNRDAATTAYTRQLTLQHDQQAYNTQMWQMNNAYNSPSAQRERWESAGFSPWTMATGGAGAGGLSSAPSSGQGSAPQAQATAPPVMQPMQALQSPIGMGLGLSIELGEQRLKQQAQLLNSLDVSTRSEAQKSLEKLQRDQGLHYEALVSYLGAKKEEQDVINKYLDDTTFYKLQLLIRSYNNAIIDSNAKVTDIDETLSRIDVNKAQKRLFNGQARSIEIKNEADWRLLENYIAAQLSMYILEEYINDETMSFYRKHPKRLQAVLESTTSYDAVGPWTRIIMEILGLVPKFATMGKGAPKVAK